MFRTYRPGLLRCAALAVCFAVVASAKPTADSPAPHPLDPLTWQEHWTVLEVLREAGHLDEDTRFGLVTLREPSKRVVWEWEPGRPFPREAFAIVKQGDRTYEAAIDLSGRTLASWTAVEDVQPPLLMEEMASMGAEIKKHPDVVQAMKRRGIEDLVFIDCVTMPLGYFGTSLEQGRRIAHGMCQDSRGARNTVPRRIEGLTVLVDLNTREVLQVVDQDVVPVPHAQADFDEASIGPPRHVPTPIAIAQPLGPSFDVQRQMVSWQKWSFHVRVDHRVGLVVSTVRYRDGERDRRVLYQGSLSEIFVPYMDPSLPWYAQNYLDAGEFAMGGLAKPLEPGLDCPDNAVYFDTLVAGDNGRPRAVPRVACLFERYAGDMAWRHHEGATTASRPKRDLVLRMIATLGNYDYVFDWTFQQDGTIRIAAGATGISQVKAVVSRRATPIETDGGNGGNGGSATALERADAYGRFVAENLVAVNHDHFMNFRLDLDVDGPDNSLIVDRLRVVELPRDHPRRSLWVTRSATAEREADAKLHADMQRPALWRIANPGVHNHVGYPVSYQIVPGMTAMSLLSPDDYPQGRAGFTAHHLWVTPYDADERYAAGTYPTLSKPGDGLPQWTSANRSIQNTDIVVWYTMGMHHVVRAEDWPVMPVSWQSVEIRPFDFFERNPALDLPKKP